MKNPTRLVLALGSLTALLACSVSSSNPPGIAGLSAQSGQSASGPVSRTGSLSGTVSLRGVGPLAGLEVKVYAAESGPQMPHWTATTDASGRYEIALPDGTYNLMVRKPGSNLASARFGVQAGTVVNFDLVPTGTVMGKVRLAPLGAPVGTDIFVPGTGLSAKASFDGSFTLSDVPVGTYRLVAVRQGFGLVQSAEFEVTPSATEQLPELVLSSTRDLRTLTGKVTVTGATQKTQGTAVPACWQVITPEATLSPEGVLVTVISADGETATASTAADGSYRVENFPAGVWTFHFEKPGFFDQWKFQTIYPNQYGAGDVVINPIDPLASRRLAITPLPYSLGIGQTFRLTTAYSNPQMGPQESPEAFTWTSSAPAVLTVDRGVVTAVGTGSAVVTVTDPEDDARVGSVSVSVQPFREDSITGQLNLAVLDNPGELRLGWSGEATGSGLVPAATGLVVKDGLCAGDYRLTWERPAGASSSLLQSYRSKIVQVPHRPSAIPQANLDLTWDWLPVGVATDGVKVEPGATFSVAFNPYSGAGAYRLEVLASGSVVQTSVATDSTVIVETAPATAGNYSYRLSITQGAPGAGGFEGRTIDYPLLVGRYEFSSISPDSFVAIPPGTFEMGESPDWPNATQSVTLTRGFFIQKTHVTQAQWQSVMGNNPSYFQGCSDCPVEQVRWIDAISFANALSRREGLPEVYYPDGTLQASADIYSSRGYRLPTEAEWEYAYRAGTTTRWYNGDDESKVGEIAWYYDNSGFRTHPVALKEPNAFGLFDMAGNVWQWTNDWYADYPGGAVTDPAGPATGSARVFRGGSWYVDGVASYLRAAARHNPGAPDASTFFVGFRLARSRP